MIEQVTNWRSLEVRVNGKYMPIVVLHVVGSTDALITLL